MNRIEELIHVLETDSVRRRSGIARAEKRCKICGQPAVTFRTLRAELEYNLSAICESCQDYYLSN